MLQRPRNSATARLALLLSALWALALLCPGLARAQSIVSPRSFASAEADSENRYPFGNRTGFRYLQVHDDIQKAFSIGSISFRRAGLAGPGTTVAYPAFSVTLDLWISTAAVTSTKPNYSFAANHGKDRLQVLKQKTIQFPPTQHRFVPNPFVYRIPFDRPFPFAGKGSLCWEVLLTKSTAQSYYYFDAVFLSSVNPKLAISSFGTGCKVSGRKAPMRIGADSTMDWKKGMGTLHIDSTEGPSNSFVAGIFGFSPDQFAAFKLPFLFPGTDKAPSGPCHLYTDVILTSAALTNSIGAARLDWPVFAIPQTHGLRMFAQELAFDAKANSYGMVFSNAINMNWVAPYGTQPVSRVFTTTLTAKSGFAALGSGLVTLFEK